MCFLSALRRRGIAAACACRPRCIGRSVPGIFARRRSSSSALSCLASLHYNYSLPIINLFFISTYNIIYYNIYYTYINHVCTIVSQCRMWYKNAVFDRVMSWYYLSDSFTMWFVFSFYCRVVQEYRLDEMVIGVIINLKTIIFAYYKFGDG